ncbi:MAG TPA: ATP-binding protein [Archangium sp.]
MRALVPQRLVRQLPPDWELARREWEPCLEFFARCGLDRDEAYAMTMATSELLENAIKYGAWRGAGEQITLSLEAEARAVVVEIESPIADDAATLRRLDDRIQWMRSFQSPFQAYVERLKEVSSQTYQEGESGLGLCRIAYEARCLLDFYVTGEGRLAMSAVYLPREGLT